MVAKSNVLKKAEQLIGGFILTDQTYKSVNYEDY